MKLNELGWLVFMSIVVGFVVGACGITTLMFFLGFTTSLISSFAYAGGVGLVYLVRGLYINLKK